MAINLQGVGNRLETLTPVTEEELTGFWDRLVITKVEDMPLPTVAGSEDNVSSISKEAFDAMVRTENKGTRDIANVKVSHEISGVDNRHIETRIVTKEVYQNVFRNQQQKALRDASAMARASLKQIPDKSDRRIAFNRLKECLERCPPDALGSDKTAYAGCLNTQALFYLSGMPLCDNKTAIKRANALFVQAASLGDDAAGSAHYHLAKGCFFSAISLKDLDKRKRSVDACKLHINKVFAVDGSPYSPGCFFYEKCLQISKDFSKPIEYEGLRGWCDSQGADYLYYYANLLGKDSSASDRETRQLREFEGLVDFPDDKFSDPYRKCKARARLGILYYKLGDFTKAIRYLVAGFQSSVAQVWRCLYNMALLDEKGVKIAAAFCKIYPNARDVFGFELGEVLSSEGAEKRYLEVLSEAHRITQSAIPQEKVSLESLRGVELPLVVIKMCAIEAKLRAANAITVKADKKVKAEIKTARKKPSVKKYTVGLQSLLDRHERFIVGLDPDRVKVPAPTLLEVQTFIDDFVILDVSFHENIGQWKKDKFIKDTSAGYKEMFEKAGEQMGLLAESVKLLKGIKDMPSYQDVGTGEFESRMAKDTFAAGTFGGVKKGFLVEDSSKQNLTLNYDYKPKMTGQPPLRVGVSVVAKKAIGDTREYIKEAQDVLKYEKNILGKLLDHPNIVQILPSEGGGDTMVMRDAGTNIKYFFDVLVAEEKKLEDINMGYKLRIAKMDYVARILAQLLNAVIYIHENGCVHGDIKLDNITIDPSGRVRLIDFGSVKEVGEGIDLNKTVLTEPFSRTKGAVVETSPDIWTIGEVLIGLVDMDLSADSFGLGRHPGGFFGQRVYDKIFKGHCSDQMVKDVQGNIRNDAEYVRVVSINNLDLERRKSINALGDWQLSDKDKLELKERVQLINGMQLRHVLLSDIAIKLLEPKDSERISIDEAFRELDNYPGIEGVLSILNGKCEKEWNFGTELYAKIKPKHP